ncbi:cupin domain-containing protein [Hyphomonas johnsonii]|uniref:ChrR-like cupin domain-containing protein n=1 Tax=Hyphomonas johnsonii MHS-2 TaxID=1280950 RepID=A0A059FU53_9PROT|nr:cupin domain-containing protein [Hyphomonas johnsonii]KCZ94204.1 hypothetical protein HJO_02480 [Hyphomonas johnsonii MHS-2]
MSTQESYATFMMDHAAGNHAEAFALAGDLHIALSADGAEAGLLWAVIGGALLENAARAAPRPAAGKRRQKAHREYETAEMLLAGSDTMLDWKRGISGVAYARTATPGASFMKLEPGQAAPMHGHSNIEATVVLSGQFSDGHGVYSRGDLVLGEPGQRHKPAAIGDEQCICFVAEKPRPFWKAFLK